MQNQNTSFWVNRTGFMLASIGAAVGLGNIWKFPYMAGTQGGGAFVLIYLLSIFAIAIPIAAAELLVGRHGQSDAVNAVRNIAEENGHPRSLAWIGGIGVFSAFILLTFYAVIAGWVSAYVFNTLSGELDGLSKNSTSALFSSLLANPAQMIGHQILFLLLLGLILTRNLAKGLERANLVLIPALIIMLLVIAIYGGVAGDLEAALKFLFVPDFSKITPDVVQSAVGHGFFSVGVGAAMLMTYGAYLNHKMAPPVDLAKTAIIIGLTDTAIALLAGIGIFAIVFGQGLDSTAGPGLIFITLPLAFSQMPGGHVLAFIFFMLVYFAALTSGLSLAEVIIRWAENRFGLNRSRAGTSMLVVTFLVGLATVFSFNDWQDVRLASQGVLADKTLFEVKDYLVTTYIMPLGGLGIIVFASWLMPVTTIRDALGNGGWLFILWLWSARLLAPLGIIWIFVANL